ncbi:PilZ domain-containing protein [Butyrivibrio sp. WCE2006]|uniref:PilZ domain-containing protein n=1 Tax=Butyrivibrio sp. WCE2006 TaxID=1410611 RepID=UPI0005D157E5|nr:PilZ domain-containing protein [Butyrivibrio sp. WCE2006]
MKDSKIKIHASINGHGILLITKAEVGVSDGLLVDSLTYFDEDLTFSGLSKIIAVNKRDGRSYEFEANRIGPVETKYGKFHLIRCTDEGKIINRRAAERYDIDRLGVIRIGESKDIRNALVYDISMRGIAFILDKDASVKVGDHVIASFRYDPAYFHFYACEATVVRIFTMNDQPAIGCTLDSMGADLVTLIRSRKKEKLGIKVDDILDTAKSPDEGIASGKKIPVNYVPQLAASRDYEKNKYSGKWELNDSSKDEADTEKTSKYEKLPSKKTALAYQEQQTYQELPPEKENAPENLEPQLMSPDEAADLIPERSEAEIMLARANRVADMNPIEDEANQPSYIAEKDLEEVTFIEDRTPGMNVPEPKELTKSLDSQDPDQQYEEELAAIEDRTPVKAKKLYPKKPANPLDDLKKQPGKATQTSKRQVADLAELEGRDFNPSEQTKKKLDFISSIVGDVNELKSLIGSSGSSSKPRKKTKLTDNNINANTIPQASSMTSSASGHQMRFVDAYNSPSNAAQKNTKPKASEEQPVQTGISRASGVIHATSASIPNDFSKSNASLPDRAPSLGNKKISKNPGAFPDDYDGYFNQSGNAIDEGLFLPKQNDGFLSPEQIADIIELERISKNE